LASSSSALCNSPNADPNFDLGWRHGDTTFVVEVKSLTAANEAMAQVKNATLGHPYRM